MKNPAHRRGTPSTAVYVVVPLVVMIGVGAWAGWRFTQRPERQTVVQPADPPQKVYKIDPKTGTLTEVDPDAPEEERYVGEFELIERSGRKVKASELIGKPWAVCFVFTKCAGVCLRVRNALADLQPKLDDADVRLVTITVDPDYDSPAVLTNYAEGVGADPDKWLFLTGPKDEIYTVVKGMFQQPLQELHGEDRKPGFEVIHSSDVIHVHADGRIGKKYVGTNPNEMDMLARALKKEAAELKKKSQPAVAEKPR